MALGSQKLEDDTLLLSRSLSNLFFSFLLFPIGLKKALSAYPLPQSPLDPGPLYPSSSSISSLSLHPTSSHFEATETVQGYV
mgnify:CR=1 FL=1